MVPHLSIGVHWCSPVFTSIWVNISGSVEYRITMLLLVGCSPHAPLIVSQPTFCHCFPPLAQSLSLTSICNKEEVVQPQLQRHTQ